MATTPRIGFIGLGSMARGRARNLLDKDFALTAMAHRRREASLGRTLRDTLPQDLAPGFPEGPLGIPIEAEAMLNGVEIVGRRVFPSAMRRPR